MTVRTTDTMPNAQHPAVKLGLPGHALLLPAGLYRATVREIDCYTDGPEAEYGEDEAQFWSFIVALPAGGEIEYVEMGQYIAEYDAVVRWADRLLRRPYLHGDGRMPNAEERARLVGLRCAIRFSLHCWAAAQPRQQGQFMSLDIPGGEITFTAGQPIGGDWSNRIEDVCLPEDVFDEDEYFDPFGLGRLHV